MDQASYNNGCSRRKRHLSDCDPEMCEFMPLSKRINNLHLNGTQLSSETSSTAPQGTHPCECQLQPSTSRSMVQCSLCNPNLYGITRQALPLPDLVNIPNAVQMANNRTPLHQKPIQSDIYSPEMDVNSNPHYYTNNKLLFDLHIERVKRHGFPNKYDG